MDNKRSLDDLFKQQRQSYDRTPSSELWTRLEKKLEQRPPRRAIVSVWWQVLTVAAVLLLLLLPIAYFTVINQPNKTIAQNAATDQEKITEPETTDPVADTLAMVQQTTISKQETDKAKNRQSNASTTVAEPAAKESVDSHPPAATAPAPVRDQHSKATQPAASEQKSPPAAVAPIRESAAPDDNALSTTRHAETADNSKSKKAAIKPTTTTSKPTLPALHLESGKAKNYLDALCQYGGGVADMPIIAKGTITDQDVADLLPLLHSTRPCAAVQLSGQTAPHAAQIQSTEGNEAYWLIKAYNDKKAYPIQKISVKWVGNSVELYNTTSEIEKLEQWWRDR